MASADFERTGIPNHAGGFPLATRDKTAPAADGLRPLTEEEIIEREKREEFRFAGRHSIQAAVEELEATVAAMLEELDPFLAPVAVKSDPENRPSAIATDSTLPIPPVQAFHMQLASRVKTVSDKVRDFQQRFGI